ncbi:MAG: saccharopine dehydrogenase C-terminal domain-containing protein [Candidatus Acidiferrales bacterium]
MKITVLGAGLMGRAVVWDLAGATEVKQILVADFDRARARQVAAEFGRGKASSAFADVREILHLAKLLKGSHIVVNCTQYNWNLDVMHAALAARIHYLDLGGLYHMTRRQFSLDEDFRRIGKIAIVGMGGAPGTTNIMARHLSDPMDRVDSIIVYNASTDLRCYDSPIAYSFSIATILDELTMPPVVFRNRRFEERPMLSDPVVDTFPKPIGKVTLRNSIHSELGTIPLSFRDKGVREVYFKINYDPALVHLVRNLDDVGFTSGDAVAVNGSRVVPRQVLLALLNLKAPKQTPRDVEAVRVVVRGHKNGRRKAAAAESTSKYTDKPSFSAVARDTGFPAAIVALMLARGQFTGVGVQAPENCVPPEPFFRELAKRGMPVREWTPRAGGSA